MASREVYIMQDTDDEWVQPTPARVAIREAVTSATDLEADDLGDLEEYVDIEELRSVLDADDATELSVQIEGYDVTIHTSGEIDVGN